MRKITIELLINEKETPLGKSTFYLIDVFSTGCANEIDTLKEKQIINDGRVVLLRDEPINE